MKKGVGAPLTISQASRSLGAMWRQQTAYFPTGTICDFSNGDRIAAHGGRDQGGTAPLPGGVVRNLLGRRFCCYFDPSLARAFDEALSRAILL